MEEGPIACHCEVPLSNGVRSVHTVLLVDELQLWDTEHGDVAITAHCDDGRVAYREQADRHIESLK